ncbi:MAG: hypothetical protein JWP89_6532 [Schlesneria sp.]|nr:hypothetical protein [Schlesneria sp.]
MKRQLFVVGICLGFISSAIAADLPQKVEASAKAAVPPRIISGRTQLEALLLSPANLDFEGRKHVTVREVLDQLHQQHHLSLRFDTPTLASMLDKSSQTPAYRSAQVATNYMAPLGFAACYPGVSCQPGVVHIQSSQPAFPVAAAAYYSPDEAGDIAPAQPGVQSKAPAATAPAPASSATPNVAVAPAAAAPQVGPQAPMPAVSQEPPVSATPAPATEAPAPAQAAPPIYYEPGTSSQAPPFDKPGPAVVQPEAPSPKGIQQILEELLDKELDIQTLDLSRVSIATVLRQALDAAPTAQSDEVSGMPILMTNAALLDYLIEDDGLLITTRMKALSTRETRVYSIKHLQDLPAEQLAKTIRQSIRPWSWRSQISDLGEQLKGTPIPGETLTSLVKTGVQLVGAEVGVDISPESTAEPKTINRADEARQMEMLGGAITNGLVTFAQTTLLALEMVHYAEPPTASIQTLGHKLIITQSQTAHREIAELLKQLADD